VRLGRRDSNFCILKSEFAKTLSQGGLELAHLELKARPVDANPAAHSNAYGIGSRSRHRRTGELRHDWHRGRLQRHVFGGGHGPMQAVFPRCRSLHTHIPESHTHIHWTDGPGAFVPGQLSLVHIVQACAVVHLPRGRDCT
jgi:hypothetical protein